MPSYIEHVRRSAKRTGESYRELNEWLDGDKVPISQRLQRHIRIKKYSEYVRGKWGEKGLKEYRSHLNDDFRMSLSTLTQFLRRKLSRLAAQLTGGGERKQ